MRTLGMNIDGKDDDLDVGHVLVLEHLELLLVLVLQARRQLLRILLLLDVFLEAFDELFCTVGDRLEREESDSGAS